MTVGPDKSKKNSKKAARRVLAPAPAARSERFYLSPCSKTYLKALCDPFSLDAGMACIPDLVDIPSQKIMCKARGTFAAGTQGVGYLVASPLCAVSDSTFGIVYSGTAYAGTTINVNTATAGVSGSDTGQFPYTSAQIANLQQRTVACGLRVRYLGTELNRSGRMVLGRLPAGSSASGYSMTNLLSNNAFQSIPVSRKWSYVTYIPSDESDYGYTSNAGTINSTDTLGNARLLCMIDGTTASNAFEYEVVYHKEYYSKNQNVQNVPNLSVSHSDTNGLSAIRNYLEGSVDYLGGPEAFRSAMNFVSRYAPIEVSHIATVGSALYAGARTAGYL